MVEKAFGTDQSSDRTILRIHSSYSFFVFSLVCPSSVRFLSVTCPPPLLAPVLKKKIVITMEAEIPIRDCCLEECRNENPREPNEQHNTGEPAASQDDKRRRQRNFG
eukprot:CAMPEP_0172396308 /NCGR_PEP_ID=MMETSP1061-20121228/24403_1 /TAXON_ID=37318 /ORGANISM="Pseudo-nitzschia pungens, Strain cf. pungens" /LENGTH=106 /DNA_ID=CAMNT_0013128117 /DNA_START=27 /DNA_END=347 /DNA_ORIENTATION=+